MGGVRRFRGYFTTFTIAAACTPDLAVTVITAVPADSPTAVQPVGVSPTEATEGSDVEQRARAVSGAPTTVATRRMESPTAAVAADGDTERTINCDVPTLTGSESLQASAP